MKIQINAGDRKHCIRIPTGMILSKASVWLYIKIGKISLSRAERYMPEDIDVSVGSLFDKFPEEATYAICDELRRIKKIRGNWELVNVESGDGTSVKITL